MATCEIIAEVANAHQGDPKQAAQLARESLAAGADAVKFQIYFAEEFLTGNHPRYTHFQKQSFTPRVWRKLIGQTRALEGRVYCDVFGTTALDVAAECGADGFKVHSSDLGNTHLLYALAELGKPVFLSTGGSTAQEIAVALKILRRLQAGIVLMHGFQSYPTAVEDAALCRIPWLREQFGTEVAIGYQDHAAGDDPFAVTLPLMALSMGATVLEKHVTLDRAAQGVDYYSSVEPEQLQTFIQTVRLAEKALGREPESFSQGERHYRETVKKCWVAARNLPENAILAPSDLIMKRVADPKSGPVELEKLAGRRLTRNISADQILTRAALENEVWAMVVARGDSARLPGKALLDVAGMPALQHLLHRLQQAERIHKIVLCTTLNPEDDPLARLAASLKIAVYRGPVEDVLGRMLGAVQGQEVDVMLRVTGDDILIDPEYADAAVAHHLSVNAQYTDAKAIPSGTEVEVFDARLMKDIHRMARNNQGTEYLTKYVTDHHDQFRLASMPVADKHRRNWRLTLDTPEDYQVIKTFLAAMRDQGKALSYRMNDVIAYFEHHPEVLEINARVRQRQAPPQVDTGLDWRWLITEQGA